MPSHARTEGGAHVSEDDAWLARAGRLACRSGLTDVAMESTGVYWKPVFNVLELTEPEVMVVYAQHIKAVPGRKTDVKDAEWLATC